MFPNVFIMQRDEKNMTVICPSCGSYKTVQCDTYPVEQEEIWYLCKECLYEFEEKEALKALEGED